MSWIHINWISIKYSRHFLYYSYISVRFWSHRLRLGGSSNDCRGGPERLGDEWEVCAQHRNYCVLLYITEWEVVCATLSLLYITESVPHVMVPWSAWGLKMTGRWCERLMKIEILAHPISQGTQFCIFMDCHIRLLTSMISNNNNDKNNNNDMNNDVNKTNNKILK